MSAPIGVQTLTALVSSSPMGLVPLTEYFHYEQLVRDILYDTVKPNAAAIGYYPTHTLGLVFPAGTRGPNLISVYRCRGPIKAQAPGWGFSFWDGSTACGGNPFDASYSQSTVEAFVLFATPPANVATLPLYRYRVKGDAVSVLSTVPPTPSFLTVMRYQLDSVLGASPVGYVVAMDSALDGNQRWITGQSQNLCYGVSQYQTTCPSIAVAATWELVNLQNGSVILSHALGSLGELSLTAADVLYLINANLAAANMPLLLTVRTAGKIVAAKNVRLIRQPWMTQYDGTVLQDDDGEASNFPTQASAYLMANQMIANVAFTDPMVSRTLDAAAFDGIMYVDFFEPNNTGTSDRLKADHKQQHSFKAMDQQGILIGAEVPYSVYSWNQGAYAFPFDSFQRITVSPGAASPLAPISAQYLNLATGLFENYGANITTTFVPDFANPSAVDWLVSGVAPFIARLSGLGIAPAFLSISENGLQSHNMQPGADTTANDLHLPYSKSPTFSEASYRAFSSWLRAVNAPPGLVGLPALPADYATAQRALNPFLYRLQSAPGDSALWVYWSIWRRFIFVKGLGRIAKQVKAVQASQPYVRSPISLVMYQYAGWFTINGVKFDPISNQDWPQGFQFDADSGSLFVDPGEDFLISSQQDPGAFDYYVSEIKGVDDATAAREAQRMVAFKSMPLQPVTPKIGLHVEIEGPYSAGNADYMNTNMFQIFPGASFKTPAFDLVFAWEAQCEYVLSMKVPDPSGVERLDVEIQNGQFAVVNAGGYEQLIKDYASVIGPYCLYRHSVYNLGRTCSGGVCADSTPHAVLRDNLNRLLTWRFGYLSAQRGALSLGAPWTPPAPPATVVPVAPPVVNPKPPSPVAAAAPHGTAPASTAAGPRLIGSSHSLNSKSFSQRSVSRTGAENDSYIRSRPSECASSSHSRWIALSVGNELARPGGSHCQVLLARYALRRSQTRSILPRLRASA